MSAVLMLLLWNQVYVSENVFRPKKSEGGEHQKIDEEVIVCVFAGINNAR